MAKGILSEDHPWYAGVLFHALSDRVAETHKQADLVIGVGYDPVEFNYEDWMPKAPLPAWIRWKRISTAQPIPASAISSVT
jgi:acetolactate synthase-1/2/3 large subunit